MKNQYGFEEEDYYSILNVSRNAGKSDIRQAFIKLQNTYGRQNQALYSLVGDEESQAMLKIGDIAYRVLYDDSSRRDYDIKMGWYQAHDIAVENQAATHSSTFLNNPFENIISNSYERPENEEHRYDGHGFGAPAIGRTPARSFATSITATNTSDENVRKQMNEIIESSDPSDGALYRKLRELAGVEVEEMQERTKVLITYIKAIEANEYKLLPSPVFVRGFLKSYLRYLRVNEPDKLVKAFSEKMEANLHPKQDGARA